MPLDGIISFDPVERFKTVSNSSLRNVYQTLAEPNQDDPQTLSPLLPAVNSNLNRPYIVPPFQRYLLSFPRHACYSSGNVLCKRVNL